MLVAPALKGWMFRIPTPQVALLNVYRYTYISVIGPLKQSKYTLDI